MNKFLDTFFRATGMVVVMLVVLCLCYYQDASVRHWVDRYFPQVNVLREKIASQAQPSASTHQSSSQAEPPIVTSISPAALPTPTLMAPTSEPQPLISPPTNTPSSTTAKTSQQLGEEFSQFSKCLVTVEGDKAIGSGFLVKIANKAYVATNAHVMSGLSGGQNWKVRTLDGTILRTGALTVAKNVDLALVEVAYAGPFLPICQSFGASAQMGDRVLVLGNSEGKGVATDLGGKINGIGPDKIEVDAKFVEGNSGSPVILAKTGEAIGIATYYTVAKIEEFSKKSAAEKDSPFWDIRRFACRLDAATGYDFVSVSTFAQEAAYIDEFNEHTENIYLLASDIAFNDTINIDWHHRRYNHLAIPIQEYVQTTRTVRKTDHNSTDQRQRFLVRLAYECAADISLHRKYFVSTYHLRELDEIEADRKRLEHLIDRLLTQ